VGQYVHRKKEDKIYVHIWRTGGAGYTVQGTQVGENIYTVEHRQDRIFMEHSRDKMYMEHRKDRIFIEHRQNKIYLKHRWDRKFME
jgi:hypothetical protein